MKMTFVEALNGALCTEMENDPTVFLFGIGLPTRDNFFGSVEGLLERFGPDRVIDTPVAEEAMTGFGLGAAVNGYRGVMHHIRADFALLSLNQLANMIAPYTYSTVGRAEVPLTIRTVVGRGFGQGAQHSKSLHSLFAHIPGLKVVLPTTPQDAWSLLRAAIRDPNPVIVMEHRWLYWAQGEVQQDDQISRLEDAGEILRKGVDATVVATSWMAVESLKAAEVLQRHHGVSIEVCDPKTIAPFDHADFIYRSVEKSGHCIVADGDWLHCGFGAEVAARVSEMCFGQLKSAVTRVGWKHVPIPTARVLENAVYCNAEDIIRAVEAQLDLPEANLEEEEFYQHGHEFRGPF